MPNKVVDAKEIASATQGAADFPKHSLKVALRVAEAIEEKNSGNPLPPTDVAIAMDKSPGSSDFRMLLSSSIKYGLTSGSYNQEKVALGELGRDIVEPTTEETRKRALLQAAFRPDVFKRIFDAYKNKKVPDAQFFQNALVRDFNVSRDQAGRCATIFLENAGYLGLIKQATTGKWIGAESESLGRQNGSAAEPEGEDTATEGVEIKKPVHTAASRTPAKNAIFIGHGKNKAPLQQLEKFLTDYNIPHKVAIDEANRGRPISQKVADVMNECGAAIIIFTADEEFRTPAGDTIYRPSENAVFELGAASALYGSRIVIFKEASVTFPSNFDDIGRIEFEKDHLDAKVNMLLKELIGFKLITLTVGVSA